MFTKLKCYDIIIKSIGGEYLVIQIIFKLY